jgi:hypothetical protein
MENKQKYSVVIPRKIFILPILTAIISVLFLSISGATASPFLGTANNYAVLAASKVANDPTLGTGTVITTNLGLTGTDFSGFPPGIVTPGTPDIANSAATTAQTDANTAFNTLMSAPCPAGNTFTPVHDLGGTTLGSGTYCDSSGFTINKGETFTLDGPGTYIFQMPSTTLVTFEDANMILKNGADPCNVFWVVGSSATLAAPGGLATSPTHFYGNVIAKASIGETGGIKGTLLDVTGRLLALTGAVTFASSTIVTDEACQPGGSGGSSGGAVGGTIMPIDMTSLFVAGAMTNTFWVLPTLGGIAGAAIALFKVKRKSS